MKVEKQDWKNFSGSYDKYINDDCLSFIELDAWTRKRVNWIRVPDGEFGRQQQRVVEDPWSGVVI